MLQNAEEIKRLSARIDKTVRHRSESREKHREWESACAEFHERYRTLAFPGGYDGALKRIVAGDEEAMEAAICFLECRPYFFRSGYMFKEILREAKRAPRSRARPSRFTGRGTATDTGSAGRGWGARHLVAQSEAFRRALEKAERSELNVLIDPARRRIG